LKRVISAFLATACLLSFSATVQAHDPVDYLGAVWQWPATHLPVLDSELNEWDIIPEEFWITEQKVVQSTNRTWIYTGDLDVSSIAFRWIPTWNEETNRIYYAYERFDDRYQGTNESIETSVDADHSGGNFWSLEGQTDEEMARTRGRHAQISHYWFDDGNYNQGQWNWFWMTQADWYDVPPYSDHAYWFSGTAPDSFEEMRQRAEWWSVYWDDFNWADPDGSIIHDFEAGEIIGLMGSVFDADDTLEDDCNCESRWALNPNVESFGDADFLADFLLLDVDEAAFEGISPTAVEDNTWGQIKASFNK
jgi:hypothetical protein